MHVFRLPALTSVEAKNNEKSNTYPYDSIRGMTLKCWLQIHFYTLLFKPPFGRICKSDRTEYLLMIRRTVLGNHSVFILLRRNISQLYAVYFVESLFRNVRVVDIQGAIIFRKVGRIEYQIPTRGIVIHILSPEGNVVQTPLVFILTQIGR